MLTVHSLLWRVSVCSMDRKSPSVSPTSSASAAVHTLIPIHGLDKVALLRALWTRAGKSPMFVFADHWLPDAALEWFSSEDRRWLCGRRLEVNILGDHLHYAHLYDEAAGKGVCASVVHDMYQRQAFNRLIKAFRCVVPSECPLKRTGLSLLEARLGKRLWSLRMDKGTSTVFVLVEDTNVAGEVVSQLRIEMDATLQYPKTLAVFIEIMDVEKQKKPASPVATVAATAEAK